jgi:hypothetical protein
VGAHRGAQKAHGVVGALDAGRGAVDDGDDRVGGAEQLPAALDVGELSGDGDELAPQAVVLEKARLEIEPVEVERAPLVLLGDVDLTEPREREKLVDLLDVGRLARRPQAVVHDPDRDGAGGRVVGSHGDP